MSDTMQLYEVRDWLKTIAGFDNYYIGKLDQKPDKALGLYRLASSGSPIQALGGKQNSSYNIKQVSLLVHWTNNFKDTEQISDNLFEKIMNAEHPEIGDWNVPFIGMLVSEPQDVGTDDKGIYEAVIEFEIYYERKK
jgi:hypothetical protein